MAPIHDHPHPVHLANHADPKAGETHIDTVGTTATDGVELVEDRMAEAHAERVVGLDHVKVALQTAEALQVDAHGQLPCCPGPLDVADVLDKDKLVRSTQDMPTQAGDALHRLTDVVTVTRWVAGHEVEAGGFVAWKEPVIIADLWLVHEHHVTNGRSVEDA